MTKKKWALLIAGILLLFGYVKLFYKTYTETAVAKSADCIIALDIKRVTNTVIWNIITTPSQWKFSTSPDEEEDKVNWDDMVKLPDYVFLFHAASHPANAWYTVAHIKDEADFKKGLQQYHFKKRENAEEYFSILAGIEFIQNGDKILVGNLAVEDKKFIRQVAAELFVKKQFAPKETLKTTVAARSHLAVQWAKNNFLLQPAVIKANFDKNTITVDGSFSPAKQFSFAENNFSYAASSLFSLGFTQPSAALYNLIADSTKANISSAMNFNIDSLLVQNNTCYKLDIAAIVPGVDSAITYTYDDNFNPIEKAVVNNILEPSFNFTVNGNGTGSVYRYWNNNGKLEKTAAGELFVPVPFVKSYCSKLNAQKLAVVSNNYQAAPNDKNNNCIFFLNLLLTKIPNELLKFLPYGLMQAIGNIESLQLLAKKNNGQIFVHCSVNKKKNDLPIIQ